MVAVYTKADLLGIAKHYREPLKLAKLESIADIKDLPYSTFLSYLIGKENLGREALSDLLKDPEALEAKLFEFDQTKTDDDISLQDGLSLEDDAQMLASSIKNRNSLYARGSDNVILVASSTPKVYTYPSGFAVAYFLLSDEIAANVSIFEFGYGGFHIPKDESIMSINSVFVRENFVKMMLSLMDVKKDENSLVDYQRFMDDFEDKIIGIIAAHELCEIEMVRSKKYPEDRRESELQTEHQEKIFLEEHGIDMGYYELFHLLRAGRSKNGRKNISKKIVDRGFQPLG